MAGLSYAPVLQVDNRLVATLCRCTRHLPYVLSTFTLGPVQLLGMSDLRPTYSRSQRRPAPPSRTQGRWWQGDDEAAVAQWTTRGRGRTGCGNSGRSPSEWT